MNPAYAAAYTNRGNVKTHLNQNRAALADYDRAIELNPAYAGAYNNRGFMKEKLGRITEARADYQQALALAQEIGDEKLVAMVKANLSRLNNNAAP